MVAASKLINVYIKPSNDFHCSQVVHPGISCRNFFLTNIFGCTKSSLFYFLPLFISQILIRGKGLNRKSFIDALKFYLQTSVCASSVNCFGYLFMCIYRNLTKNLSIHLTTTAPALAAWTLFRFFPASVKNLYLIGCTHSAIETILRERSNMLTRFIFDSKTVQTIIFMISSCVILYNKRSKVYKGFWFITPNPIQKVDTKKDDEIKPTFKERSTCVHSEKTCWKFFFNGIQRNVAIGLSLDLFNTMMRLNFSSGTKGVWHTLFAKLKNLRLQNFGMTFFLIANIGIYRISTCALRSYFSDEWTEILSSFLSGASYICYGKLSINTFSFVIAVQILWELFCKQPSQSKQKRFDLREHLKTFQFAPIIVALSLAITIHHFVAHYHCVSSLGRAFLNGTGNYHLLHLHNFMTLSMDEYLRKAASYPVQGFF